MEEEELKAGVVQGSHDIKAKEEGILALTGQIEQLNLRSRTLEQRTVTLTEKRDALLSGQKEFFSRREELSEHRSRLDKEAFRLNSQRERLEESAESQANYMWEEYELTYNSALPLRDEAYEELGDFIGEKGYFSMIFDFRYADLDIASGSEWFKRISWTVRDLRDKIMTSQAELQKHGWGANFIEDHDLRGNVFFPAWRAIYLSRSGIGYDEF